ncbi:hypothetical protein IFR04_008236 [Cadophora malorum]|uniref:Rhodopsin domain-containing protein n=1 Tax=Cadophora malorum TaxID=108018 RepID=A0A8H7TGR4_9HELO|nr:hypothetical protein IFR04_008236 [Cadophora malorum]
MVSSNDFPLGTPNRLGMRVGCYVLFALATIAVLIRLYFRTIVARKLGLDDVLITFSWLAETVHIVAVKLQFENGVGWHVSDLQALPNASTILSRMILWPWITQALYYFGLGCIKANLHRRVLWGTFAFTLAQGLISTIVVAAFLCSPLEQVWTNPKAIGGPTCINILTSNYFNAAFFIISDVFLALAPLAIIRNLQMNAGRKRALGIMFSLGILAIGGTIARQITNAVAITNVDDFTWHWAPTALSSILESSLGIIFVCVPALAPLFQTWVSGSSACKYSDTSNLPPHRPETFGKLGNKLRLRPEDDSILCVTQVTAADMEDRDAGEGYEMDIVEQYPSDAGSERRIIHPSVLNHSDDKRESRTSRKSVRRNGVRVDVEYHVDRSER